MCSKCCKLLQLKNRTESVVELKDGQDPTAALATGSESRTVATIKKMHATVREDDLDLEAPSTLCESEERGEPIFGSERLMLLNSGFSSSLSAFILSKTTVSVLAAPRFHHPDVQQLATMLWEGMVPMLGNGMIWRRRVSQLLGWQREEEAGGWCSWKFPTLPAQLRVSISNF